MQGQTLLICFSQIRRLREGLPPLDISSTKENNVSETIPSHGHAAPVGHQQQQQQQLGKLPGSRAAGQNMPPRGSWDVPDQAAINAGLQGVQGPARRSVPVMS